MSSPDDKTTRPGRTRVSILGLAQAAGFLLVLGTLAAFGGRWNWLLELTTHFRVQYALGLVLLAGGFAWRRRWLTVAGFAVGALVNVAVLLPDWFATAPQAFDTSTPPLRLLSLNVHTSNPRHAEVLESIARHRPDIVLLIEVNADWLAALAPLERDFPHTVKAPREDNFGIALFSRRPLAAGQVIELREAGVPSIEAQVNWEGRSVTLLGTHPLPPVGRLQARLRNGQLQAVATHIRSLTGPRLLLGDLNLTPWSPHFRDLERDGGLRDSRHGFGWKPTWPAWFPPLWIPIDHCLVSDDFVVRGRQVLERVGSDHLPILIDLAWATGN